MILATSAVHSWLTRKGLRTFTSLNVRSGECIDPHYFAVLIGQRRDDGQRLSGAGFDRRPDRAGADRGDARGGGGAVPHCDRPGAAEDHLEDGDRGDLLLSRGVELRGGRAQPGDGGGVFPRDAQPDLGHRHHRGAAAGRGHACARLARRRRGAADRRLLQGAALGREPRLGGAGDAHPAVGLRPRVVRGLEAVFEGDAGAAADPPARPPGLPAEGGAGADRPGRVDHRDPQAVRDAGDEPRGAQPGGAQDAERGDEPDRGEVGLGRGGRGPGALSAGAERGQPERQDQAGGERAVRGDGRLPEPLRGAGDQDRSRREARRGRAAAGDQGDRADREAAAFDAGGEPDLAAAAPRHLLDRGPGAADLRPEADQPAGARLREAGLAVGGGDDRGGGGEGEGRRDPDLGAQRRHRGVAADLDQVRRAAVGDGAFRGAPGADDQRPARAGDPQDRRRAADRAGTS